jgi:hypothetical protein
MRASQKALIYLRAGVFQKSCSRALCLVATAIRGPSRLSELKINTAVQAFAAPAKASRQLPSRVLCKFLTVQKQLLNGFAEFRPFLLPLSRALPVKEIGRKMAKKETTHLRPFVKQTASQQRLWNRDPPIKIEFLGHFASRWLSIRSQADSERLFRQMEAPAVSLSLLLSPAVCKKRKKMHKISHFGREKIDSCYK